MLRVSYLTRYTKILILIKLINQKKKKKKILIFKGAKENDWTQYGRRCTTPSNNQPRN